MESILSFILLLGVLIFVHEFGHFIVAKLCGVKVLKFSLGFGPKIFGKQYGETEYLISAFPLGGYVKMHGEQLTEDVEPDEDIAGSFAHKPIWQRFLIVASGPIFNLLFSVLVFFLLFAAVGLPLPKEGTIIGQVTPDSAAETAGLQAGDIIKTINDHQTIKWQDVSRLIQGSAGDPVVLTVDRDGQLLEFTGQPTMQETKNIFGEVVGERLIIGISRTDEIIYERVSMGEAFSAGAYQTWSFISLTTLGIIKMIQRVIPASEIGGPILIAQLTSQQMEAGWTNFIHFMGLLSVNLGILNLLPIPMLDGGHLVFFSVEAIRRKPLSMRTRELWQQAGLVILASFMIFVFYNDIARLISKS